MFGAMRQGIYAANPISVGVTGGYALFGGGYDNSSIDSGVRTNIIRKYNLATDAVSTIAATLAYQMDQVGGFANGTTGVFAGGSIGSAMPDVKLINLADESASGGQALNVNTLSTRQGRCATTATKGYIFGGTTTAPIQDVKNYTYASNTWSYNATNSLYYADGPLVSSGVHNNSTIAVISGGYANATTVPNSIIKRWTFSTDTPTTESYSLSSARAQHAVTGNQTKWVSFSGFVTSSVTLITTVESYGFSSGTLTTATSLTYGFRMGDAAGDDTRGIVSGGNQTGGGTYSTTANKIYTYSTDTYATAGAYLYTVAVDIPGAFHSLQVS